MLLVEKEEPLCEKVEIKFKLIKEKEFTEESLWNLAKFITLFCKQRCLDMSEVLAALRRKYGI